MKKTFKIIRIILIGAFLVVGIIFLVNYFSITQHQREIESVIQKETAYFNDEFFFAGDYYKYRDDENVEYWVNIHTGEFDYMVNPNAGDEKALDEDAAKQIALSAAKNWDDEFFESDYIFQLANDSQYEFYIFELDTMNHKTGRFIVVKVSGEDVEYLSMHTVKNTHDAKLGSVMSEQAAIDLAYAETLESPIILKQTDVHLTKATFAKDKGVWIWEVIIRDITQAEIQNQKEAINTETFFACRIDASTGQVISAEWFVEETDYCPLDGAVLN